MKSPKYPLEEGTGVSGDGDYTFSKNGIIIKVTILFGTVASDVYSNEDKSAISDVEMKHLMDAEADRSSWIKSNKISLDKMFVRADGFAKAVLRKPKYNNFVFYTYDYDTKVDLIPHEQF